MEVLIATMPFCPEGIIYANQILISVINCQERHVAKVIEVFLWGSKCSTQSVAMFIFLTSSAFSRFAAFLRTNPYETPPETSS